jgi:acyl-CoA thioesterase FadM
MQAKLDNSLLIESKLNKIRGASIEIDQIVKRADLDLVRM